MEEVIEILKKYYGITGKSITTQNPQANAILERAHQTIGNILRTFQVNNTEINTNDPWSRILSALIFTMHSMVQTTTQATPM